MKPLIITAALICFGLTGCAGYVKHWTPIVQSSVGRNINDVIQSWGPPSTVYAATPGPNKVYVWNDEQSYTTPGRVADHNYGSGVVNHTVYPGSTHTYTYYRMLTATPAGAIVGGEAGMRKPK